ncbi:glycosyltransferase family 4 protein [Pedobacter sp. D749]|uniref:glycosyltransferase family 4 protein n=1 Tax=Pedobacter sp. D749 TaxID=2856523 RepID=UPI001C58B50F|nr:glycosyltransferase family 4 protein [Pedobacter sp. D749]QXU41693.1 glycosyltransferase family 4 protein [Pedobacter sp. D749]
MKILFLSNCPLVESQGSGYVIVNTAKSLSALGHKVDMVPPEDLIILPKLSGTANLYRMALGMGIWVVKNRKKLKQYDSIFLYGGESYLALYLIKSFLKLKAAIILHSNGLEIHVEKKIKEFKSYLKHTEKKWYHFNTGFLFQYCYLNVDAILTVSRYDADFAKKSLNVPAKKVFYIEPALPDLFFEVEPSVTREKIITFCGSWIDRKGIDAMIQAMPKILRKYNQFKFRIIGAGYGFKVDEVFPEDVLQNIELIPFVDHKKDLIVHYNQSLIFIHPSVCESFGLTVAEAMFCGCAVITGATGIAYDLIDGVEAIVLDQPNAENLYNSLDHLINNDLLIEKLTINGKKRVQQLNWKAFENQLNQVLRSNNLT